MSAVVEPDHLVLAARDLDAGAAWLESLLGVKLAQGGKHARMGTHNRLLGLGDNFYLELIAIDPDAVAPGRPRWFGLDRADLPADRPRLIHWVARSGDIEADAARSAEPPGEILPMERGDYRWRITVPPDGHLPGDGLVPTLIQWDVPVPSGRTIARCRLPADEAGGFPSAAFTHQDCAGQRLVSALGSMCIAALPANRRNWSPICERLRA
jgi:catechol 2,3-dioxygenase-like lactoylglutathione lyase family enzyme